MITIKDIAKAAGVSHGTVSNVLNNKGNVSAKKIELVKSIASQMGYNINKSASQLRKGESKNIAIIIPDNEVQRYRDLYKYINEYVENYGYSSNLYITEGVPHKEKTIINNVLSNRVHSIIVISCLNSTDEFYASVNFNNTNIIFVEREMKYGDNNAHFFSYDANKIGYNLANYIKLNNYKNIVFFSNRKIYSFDNDIFNSLTSNCNDDSINISEYSCDTRLNIQTSFKAVFSEENYDLIITTSEEKADIIKEVIMLSKINLETEIITLTSTSILPTSTVTEYELNYKELGYCIGKSIIKNNFNINLEEPKLNIEKKYNITNTKEINIACIKGPSEDALRYISHLIYEFTGIKANIISYDYDSLFNKISNNDIDDAIDLIRFDMAWLSSFGSEILLPLSNIDYNFTNIFNSFIPGIEKEYSNIDNEKYTFPFDPSILMLFYRKDLFEDTGIKRLYFEKYKTELKIPTNYHEYNQIASFFTKSFNSESPTKYGATMTVNSPRALACQFIPIYNNLGGQEEMYGSKLHINYDVLRKSLLLFTEQTSYTSIDKYSFWGDSMELFTSGNAAMSITFSNRATTVINSKRSNVIGKFGATKLPGKHQVIGGGVLGIHNSSKNIPITCEFLEHLYSRKLSLLFACLCGSSSSKYVYNNANILDIYPWMKLVQKNLKYGKRRLAKGSFNEVNFEYYLGSYLKELFSDDSTIDECIYNISNIKVK